MKNRFAVPIGIIFVILVLAFGIGYWLYLRKAHSTFEDYYAFRGCTELISTTTDSGTCRTSNGKILTIAAYHGKWYLDGDFPWVCFAKTCFGI
ncbi:MAG: hypothetical protein KGI50_01670 [Patescibacteria group bacterium]|nr:hypothetical protein [Patescibacteria group bacterium]MDE2437948.1 hypothetical protein [Patescibacteria group bacterium]